MIDIVLIIISMTIALFVSIGWASMMYGIHDFIEINFCKSFECAVANGLVAVFSIMIVGSLMCVYTGELMYWFLEKLING